MLYIKDDGTIRLTRGDTAKLKVTLNYDDESEPYSINADDELTLSIKKSTKDVAPLVRKTVMGSDMIVIEPADTQKLSFGKYRYDIQLNTANGEVYTVVDVSIFEIMEEVT